MEDKDRIVDEICGDICTIEVSVNRLVGLAKRLSEHIAELRQRVNSLDDIDQHR